MSSCWAEIARPRLFRADLGDHPMMAPSSMHIEGSIALDVAWDGVRVASVSIDSSRPLAARRVLEGRTAADVANLVPLLFSVCGRAQAVAAAMAVAAARGEEWGSFARQASALRVGVEALQEHLWRLMVDWPERLGLPAARTSFALWHKRLATATESNAEQLARELDGFVTKELLAGLDTVRLDQVDPEWLASGDGQGLAGSVGALLQALLHAAWCHDAGKATAPLLPPMTAAAMCEKMGTGLDDAFVRGPALAGIAHETGAVARQQVRPLVAGLLQTGHRIAARVAARTVELSELVHGLRAPQRLIEGRWLDAAPLGPGAGLAAVETARGLLLHAIWLAGARVERYIIVAPTEWNFHRRGAYVAELNEVAADSLEALRQRAEALALALDPCVGHTVIVRHA